MPFNSCILFLIVCNAFSIPSTAKSGSLAKQIIEYLGDDINLILIGSSSVDNFSPSFKASLMDSTPANEKQLISKIALTFLFFLVRRLDTIS